MNQNRHVLRRSTIELKMSRKLDHETVQARVAALFREHLTPLFGEILDRETNGREDIRIESLELDLGKISLRYLDEEFIGRVAETFQTELKKRLPTVEQNHASRHRTAGGDLDLLRYFLETGVLPWWADSENPKTLAEAMERLAAKQPENLGAFLRKTATHPAKFKRLILSLEDHTLLKTIHKTLPAKARPAVLLIPALRERLRGVSETHKLRQALWQALLLHVSHRKAQDITEVAGAMLTAVAASVRVSTRQLAKTCLDHSDTRQSQLAPEVKTVLQGFAEDSPIPAPKALKTNLLFAEILQKIELHLSEPGMSLQRLEKLAPLMRDLYHNLDPEAPGSARLKELLQTLSKFISPFLDPNNNSAKHSTVPEDTSTNSPGTNSSGQSEPQNPIQSELNQGHSPMEGDQTQTENHAEQSRSEEKLASPDTEVLTKVLEQFAVSGDVAGFDAVLIGSLRQDVQRALLKVQGLIQELLKDLGKEVLLNLPTPSLPTETVAERIAALLQECLLANSPDKTLEASEEPDVEVFESGADDKTTVHLPPVLAKKLLQAVHELQGVLIKQKSSSGSASLPFLLKIALRNLTEIREESVHFTGKPDAIREMIRNSSVPGSSDWPQIVALLEDWIATETADGGGMPLPAVQKFHQLLEQADRASASQSIPLEKQAGSTNERAGKTGTEQTESGKDNLHQTHLSDSESAAENQFQEAAKDNEKEEKKLQQAYSQQEELFNIDPDIIDSKDLISMVRDFALLLQNSISVFPSEDINLSSAKLQVLLSLAKSESHSKSKASRRPKTDQVAEIKSGNSYAQAVLSFLAVSHEGEAPSKELRNAVMTLSRFLLTSGNNLGEKRKTDELKRNAKTKQKGLPSARGSKSDLTLKWIEKSTINSAIGPAAPLWKSVWEILPEQARKSFSELEKRWKQEVRESLAADMILHASEWQKQLAEWETNLTTTVSSDGEVKTSINESVEEKKKDSSRKKGSPSTLKFTSSKDVQNTANQQSKPHQPQANREEDPASTLIKTLCDALAVAPCQTITTGASKSASEIASLSPSSDEETVTQKGKKHNSRSRKNTKKSSSKSIEPKTEKPASDSPSKSKEWLKNNLKAIRIRLAELSGKSTDEGETNTDQKQKDESQPEQDSVHEAGATQQALARAALREIQSLLRTALPADIRDQLLVLQRALQGKRQTDRKSMSIKALDEIRKGLDHLREVMNRRLSDAEESNSSFSDSDALYVGNAGMVLLWPFLGRFFEKMGLMAERQFISTAAQQKAVLLLQYISSGETEFAEYQLPLSKLLCGHPLHQPLPLELELDENTAAECNALLEVVPAHNPKMKNLTAAGFQSAWLQREGVLKTQDENFVLHVEAKPYDILLEHLPWSSNMLKMQWMEGILLVEW